MFDDVRSIKIEENGDVYLDNILMVNKNDIISDVSWKVDKAAICINDYPMYVTEHIEPVDKCVIKHLHIFKHSKKILSNFK